MSSPPVVDSIFGRHANPDPSTSTPMLSKQKQNTTSMTTTNTEAEIEQDGQLVAKPTIPKPKGPTGMNCASCRKRRIKCDRGMPCQSCVVFRCRCLYNILPKKRGPKSENSRRSRLEDAFPGRPRTYSSTSQSASVPHYNLEASLVNEGTAGDSTTSSPWLLSLQNIIFPDRKFTDDSYFRVLIDKYFEKISGRTFSFIHEPSIRYLIRSRSLPPASVANSRASLIFCIAAMTMQSTNYENKAEDTEILVKLAKSHIDQDDPSIDNLQALLALAIAYLAFGDTRKSFMSVGVCSRMAIALGLLREPPRSLSPLVKETRRRCFWATYILDKYTAAGSKRFATYDDNFIKVNFPCREEYWKSVNSAAIQENQTSLANSEVQGFFSSEYNVFQQYLLVVSILGQAVQYHQLGGVEGDSHFPWHQQSRLSKIRIALQNWASRNMQQLSLCDEQLRKRITLPDGQIYMMMRAIYHAIHCLLYLNVLPMSLDELENGPALQQAWRREAVETVLQHSNHIGELAEALLNEFPDRKVDSSVPAFFGFCTFVAGIGHVYGSHYEEAPLPHRISPSKSKKHFVNEFDLLNSLRTNWKAMEHQFLILKILRKEHMSVVNNGTQKSIYYNEDILARYEVLKGVDWAHCSLAPIYGQEKYETAGAYEPPRQTTPERIDGQSPVDSVNFLQRTENLTLSQRQALGETTQLSPGEEERYEGMYDAVQQRLDMDGVSDYLEFDLLDDEMMMMDTGAFEVQDGQSSGRHMDVDPFLMSLQPLRNVPPGPI